MHLRCTQSPLPSTQEAVAQIGEALTQMRATLVEATAAEQQLLTTISRPVSDTTAADHHHTQQAEATRATVRADLLATQLRDAAGRVQAEAHVTRAVAAELDTTTDPR